MQKKEPFGAISTNTTLQQPLILRQSAVTKVEPMLNVTKQSHYERPTTMANEVRSHATKLSSHIPDKENTNDHLRTKHIPSTYTNTTSGVSDSLQARTHSLRRPATTTNENSSYN